MHHFKEVNEQYYMQIADGKLSRFDLNKKSIVAAFGSKNPELIEYLSNYAVEINTIEDLRGIVLLNL